MLMPNLLVVLLIFYITILLLFSNAAAIANACVRRHKKEFLQVLMRLGNESAEGRIHRV